MQTRKWGRELALIVGTLVLIAGSYLLVSHFSAEELKEVAEGNRLLGATIFACIMFGTTVIAPLASLPLVPVLAPFLGPFTIGLASFIGWALGAFAAFFIGRRYGRPMVAKFINMEKLKKYEEYIKPETGFVLIVLLRMMLPVDVLSYALAILSTVSFPIYASATLIGIFWFSFAFAYFGDALVRGDYVLLAIIGVASVVILGGSWHYARRIMNGRKEEI
jgi:uncharacterized membrane protein YdjX (TVP38/TMEM64 family)